MDQRIKIAIQKSGRLSEKSLALLKECGISLNNGGNKLRSHSHDFPAEALFLRDDDIPEYVQDGVADIGIIGENVFIEKQKETEIVERLGFARCRLSLAIPLNRDYSGISEFEGKRIATSYPVILQQFLDENGVNAEIHEISGSVEVAPGIGLADGICDLVSTGGTLFSNGLKEVEVILRSEAVMIASRDMSPEKKALLNDVLFRVRSVKKASKNKYILLNAPNDKLKAISEVLPGMKSPTVLPLVDEGWSSLHAVIHEDEFWERIDQLKNLGAENILVVPIEKMVV